MSLRMCSLNVCVQYHGVTSFKRRVHCSVLEAVVVVVVLVVVVVVVLVRVLEPVPRHACTRSRQFQVCVHSHPHIRIATPHGSINPGFPILVPVLIPVPV